MRNPLSTCVRLLALLALVMTSLGVASAASAADSWRTHTNSGKKENQPGYSKQAGMSSADGLATGGGGWDLVTKVWIENENGTSLGSSTGPGWQLVNVTIPRKNAVYAGCKWTSGIYSGNDTVGMQCRYYGGPPINPRAGLGWSGARADDAALARDPRVARLARGVVLANLGGGALRVASLGFAGRVDGVAYYRATDDAGRSCLVGWAPRQRVAGSACASERRIERFGPLSLQLGVRGQEHRAVIAHGGGVLAR